MNISFKLKTLLSINSVTSQELPPWDNNNLSLESTLLIITSRDDPHGRDDSRDTFQVGFCEPTRRAFHVFSLLTHLSFSLFQSWCWYSVGDGCCCCCSTSDDRAMNGRTLSGDFWGGKIATVTWLVFQEAKGRRHLDVFHSLTLLLSLCTAQRNFFYVSFLILFPIEVGGTSHP